MYDKEDRLRKSMSQNKVQSRIAVPRSNSLYPDNMDPEKRKEKNEQSLVEQVIERLPAEDWEWKMNKIEQKRNIAGLKSRIEWTLKPRGIRSVFKFSFTHCFFNQMGTLAEGDVIIELEELTFELSLDEKMRLQQIIETTLNGNMQQMKGKGFGQQWRTQKDFLRAVLIQLGEELKKLGESKKKIQPEKINQKMINRRQILYPAPVTFSWNPLGSLCITENRFPTMRRQLIGDPSALRKYFQVPKQQSDNANAGEEEQSLQISQGGKANLFDWQVDEQVYLAIFHRQQVKKNEYYNSRSPVESETLQRGDEDKGQGDSIDLGNLPRGSPKLKRAYQRYFGGGETCGHFHRYDKLKVYDILSLSRQDQDDIVFLIQRISTRPAGTSAAYIAFQNYLSAYPSLLNGPFDRLRYQILSKQLRIDIGDPQLSFGAFLRTFVLENDFFSLELQRYFRQQYRIMGLMPHAQLFGLGSYCKFDNAKAELIFMDLLRHYLVRAQQFSSIKAKGLLVRRRSCPSRLCLQCVVSDQQKSQFLMSLFPLLIIKDREMQRFEFKKIKMIISANARITAFLKKMNEFVVKMEEGRLSFLRNVVSQFYRFREDLEESSLQPQIVFLTHCYNCAKVMNSHSLPNCEEVVTCGRCKVRSKTELN